MYAQELKVIKDIEIRFFRLVPPSLNSLTLPLSGIYNDINITETDTTHPLLNKFRNFDIASPGCVNIENLYSLTTSFGKIYANETLEGLIIFINISEHEVVIKDLEITLKIDEKPETKTDRKSVV